jgi:hypothetical protein
VLVIKGVTCVILGQKQEVHWRHTGSTLATYWRHTEEIRANDAKAYRFRSFLPACLLVNPAGFAHWLPP